MTFIRNLIIVSVLIIVIVKIYKYRKYVLPEKRKREYFNQMLSNIKFKSLDEHIPYYLSETKVSKYANRISFHTFIPLRLWIAKQDILEMQLNKKVIDIKQSETDNRKINLYIETDPLPTRIDWDDKYMSKGVVFTLGEDHYGRVGVCLETTPHGFIAGETGSGKSNILKCFIHQALMKKYEVILIDFKRGVSFSEFRNEVEVYYEYKEVIRVLQDLVNETVSRLDKFRKCNVDNLRDYNLANTNSLNRKIVFIDELAELLKTRDKVISNILYESIETLTRLSRAVGIHLIMGIQRPDSTVISGQIKSNVSFRICGHFVDKEPSRIMLGTDIATNLPNIKGRFILKDDDVVEVQSFLFEGARNRAVEVQEVVAPIIDVPAEKIEPEPNKAPKIEEPKKSPASIGESMEFDFSEFRK